MDGQERIFTRGEANRMLPLLRPLVEGLRDEWQRIKHINPSIQKARDRAMSDGYSPKGVAYVESVSQLMTLMSEVRELGVLVKDLDTGLCDFPYLKQDRVVYLCWRLGEDSVEYWHDVEAGFAGREPLDESDV